MSFWVLMDKKYFLSYDLLGNRAIFTFSKLRRKKMFDLLVAADIWNDIELMIPHTSLHKFF